jgi:hypothetical protein
MSVVKTRRRPARADPIAERPRPEPGEDDDVDRADPHGGEHHHDRLGSVGM